MAHRKEQGGADLDLSSLQLSSAGPSNTTLNDPIPRIVTLNVGGRHFRTYKDTLTDTPFFRSYFYGGWGTPMEADGSFFVEVDPDIFVHILRYLRESSVYPLFWTKANGFDYNLYHRLEAAAIYFQLKDLEEWIKNKRYLKAITVKSTTTTRRINSEYNGVVQHSGDVDVERNVILRTEKVHVCPRNIQVHRGKSNACGRACEIARGGDAHIYEDEEFTEVVTTCKEYVVDNAVCMVKL